MKKISFNCIFIILIFLISIVSTSCKEEKNYKTEKFSGGKGTQNEPYIITTSEQFTKFANLVNEGDENYIDKHYILGNDIDLTEYDEISNTRISWTPIGWYNSSSSKQPFKGVFNGNNKKITGLYLKSESLQYAGLFGYIFNCTIENLGVVEVDLYITYPNNYTGISRGFYTGAIAGLSNNSNISNCYSTGKVMVYFISSLSGSYAGGIVGYNSTGSISNCYSTCSVNSSFYEYSNAGGIAGYNNGVISNCYSTGSVYSAAPVLISNSGGIIGNNEGKVLNCAALNPSISCTGYSRLFGRIEGNDGITQSKNIAFNNMLNPDSETEWKNKGENRKDGEDITTEQIYTDGTLGERFISEKGWTTQNGKLPGLSGNTVDIPKHLQQ